MAGPVLDRALGGTEESRSRPSIGCDPGALFVSHTIYGVWTESRLTDEIRMTEAQVVSQATQR